MSDTDRLLANVLADAFAHHEAVRVERVEARSLVLCDEGRETGAWVGAFLDWQHAGEVAAAVFEPAGETPDGRPLFVLPVGLAPPSRGAEAGSSEEPTSASPVSPSSNLLGRVMGIAREVFPNDARRHQFLEREIHRVRPKIKPAVLGDLSRLTDAELRTVLERIEGERERQRLAELGPGVHRAQFASVSADEAFVKLRDHFGAGS